MMSIERSGVRTWIVPWMSSHWRASARRVTSWSGARPRRMRSPAAAASAASPSRTTTQVRAPSASSKLVCRAAHGSRPAPTAPLQPVAAIQAGRPLRGAVAAEELGPIGGPGRLPPAEVEERDPAGELGVPRVAGQDRARVGVQGRDDPRRARAARRPQHPLGVGGHRQAPGAARPVLDRQHRDLERVVGRDELDEVEVDAVVEMLEPAVAGAVPGDVGRLLAPDRQGRRAPQLAGLVVADVDRLAHGVADRVVGPRRQLVLAAVRRTRCSPSRTRRPGTRTTGWRSRSATAPGWTGPDRGSRRTRDRRRRSRRAR